MNIWQNAMDKNVIWIFARTAQYEHDLNMKMKDNAIKEKTFLVMTCLGKKLRVISFYDSSMYESSTAQQRDDVRGANTGDTGPVYPHAPYPAAPSQCKAEA